MKREISSVAFGNNVRTRRIQQGKTQDELAIAIGISRQMVVKIEKGLRVTLPSLEQINLIAKFLDMSVETLTGSNEIIFERFTEEEQELLKDTASTQYIKVALAKMANDIAAQKEAQAFRVKHELNDGRA